MPIEFDQGAIAAYFQVIMINLFLSGDNVIVIGLAAAGLPSSMRNKAIMAGIGAAAVVRVIFAVAAASLLAINGIMLFGGLLLLWVCWTMFTELRAAHGEEDEASAVAHTPAEDAAIAEAAPKMFRSAITQIILADVSMSLDNVLAVAGAAKQNMHALVFGLILSVLLMGLASSLVAKLLNKYRWIGWLGLAIIVYVALDMIYEGSEQLLTLYHGSVF